MADLPKVYDSYCPSPISLEQLACMELASTLWRREVQQNIMENGTLRERYPRKKTSLRCLFPELRTEILTKIYKQVNYLQFGFPCWVDNHIDHYKILKLDVLKHFWGFVFDFDGRIDYGRTAKRFVACKGISDDVKFKMACWYCLEDDILRIWPQVSSRVMANEIDFDDKPLFRYWVCRLTNQPHEIIEELTLKKLEDGYNCKEWLCAKYFFSRLSSATRMKHIVDLLNRDSFNELIEEVFFRYMMANLDEAELKVLLNEYGAEIVMRSDHPFNLRIWANIKNTITDDGFCRLVRYILNEETSNLSCVQSWNHDFWSTAPNHIKQAAIQDVLLVDDSSYFHRSKFSRNVDVEEERTRSVSFLLTLLSDTSVEDRMIFWKAHWKTLYIQIRPADFRCLINLCFDNDQNKMISFKKEIMSNYHQLIHPELKELLKFGFLEELEEFLVFWCPNERTIKEVRLMLLLDNFIMDSKSVVKASSLNEFIERAFEDPDLATNFKKRFLVLCDMETITYLTSCILQCEFRRVMEFVDTFALSDEAKFEIKKREIMPTLQSLLNPYYEFLKYLKFLEKNFDLFENFISWLFENDDEIARFKESLDIDWVIQKLIEKSPGERYDVSGWFCRSFQRLNATPDDDSNLKKFLKWYYVTPKVVEEVEKKYSQNYVFIRLLTKATPFEYFQT